MIDKVPHIKCLQETPPRDRWLTYEEEERLLSAPPEWLRDVIIFALETGWDQGEIIALLWTDIDMDKRLAIVPRQKTETKRSTPLSDRAFSLLKRLENNNSPVVFLNDMGEPINQLTLKWRFRVLCREVGIQNFRFKDLRHTFASRLAQNGVDPYTVQKLMGHKSFSTTARYAHHFIESLRKGIKTMEKARPSNSEKIVRKRATLEIS